MNKNGLSLSLFDIRKLMLACFGAFCLFAADVNAAVVQRGTAATTTTQSRVSAGRTNTTARMPTVVTQGAAPTPTVIEEVIEEIPEPVIEEPVVVIENKSSQFAASLGTASSASMDLAADARAELIRQQRAAFAASGEGAAATQIIENALSSNKNACDVGLRDCMGKKCGKNFMECAGDGDTIWGNKLNDCRRDLQCTGAEFTAFTREIKADRDHNAKMASYTDVTECGDKYMDCIVRQCGTDFSKCLGKSTADRAISDCAKIARDCTTMDSGLASRMGQVFGTLRQNAQVTVAADEKRLYELRDLMAAQCKKLGAMFDERTLDCVFTVNFFAGEGDTLMSSKKLYAGDSFDCTPDWFGIDITTYKENAYRLTREQTSASSALMGAGLGVAAGALTSGALDRAIDRNKADNALDSAECEKGGGKWNKFMSMCTCENDKSGEGADKTVTRYKWDNKAKQCVQRGTGDTDGE